jgi:hypothetical protein
MPAYEEPPERTESAIAFPGLAGIQPADSESSFHVGSASLTILSMPPAGREPFLLVGLTGLILLLGGGSLVLFGLKKGGD